jgi:hypothetical protein
MLMRQCLPHRKGPSLDRFYRDTVLLFTEFYKKPVVLAFDQRQGSSDGGAVLFAIGRTPGSAGEAAKV